MASSRGQRPPQPRSGVTVRSHYVVACRKGLLGGTSTLFYKSNKVEEATAGSLRTLFIHSRQISDSYHLFKIKRQQSRYSKNCHASTAQQEQVVLLSNLSDELRAW